MIYTFNQCRLDTGVYQLKLSGIPVPVEPLVFDLLVYLVEQRQRVVSREELLDKLWKGRIVTDAALGARLKDARKAVQDNGSKQLVIKTFHGRGYQFIAEVSATAADETNRQPPAGAATKMGLANQSSVAYCNSDDGVSIAHAEVGEGYPVIFTGSWMTHLEEDWKNPGYGPYMSHLARNFRLIRYDQRGNGMSDWEDVEISFDRMVDDLRVVIESYAHETVAIVGCSQGASVSIAYAAKYPQKVSHLVLYGGYSRGRRLRGPEGIAESEALVALIRNSWGNENPMIRQAFTSLMMPDATNEEANWFNNFQKTCGPGENMARFRELFDDLDISDLLPEIRVPTLVVHSARDSVAPLSEGKLLASRIPGARFVTFNSRNHMIFENEAEFPRLLKCVHNFLGSRDGLSFSE